MQMNTVRHDFRRWLAISGLLVLAACGGGGLDNARSVEHPADAMAPFGEVSRADVAPSTGTMVSLKLGARLNQAELEAIAKTGVLPKPFDGPLLSGAAGSTKATLNKTAESTAETQSPGETKSAASRTAVYRFYNTQTSAHFFTTSTTERDNVRSTLAYMTYEGPAFYGSGTTVPGLSPVHRFFNTQTGVHFYTISEAERAHVVATLPQFNYEGIAYYASTLAGTGYTPLYRFFYGARGFHFYTNSAAEKDNIIATLPQYSYEGVGYYVLGSDWQTPAIPHSGVTSNQCYQAGSDTLVPCTFSVANSLNTQQDGDRVDINTMNYSELISGYFGTFPTFFPLYYPRTECVRDNVTGLIWEGKASAGSRAGVNTYTGHGDNRSGDASAYVTAVNSAGLCGYNDWRLPTVEELHNIVNYGSVGSGPKITTDWFPNTATDDYWTSTADGSSSSFGWTVNFRPHAGVIRTFRSDAHPVRLVRGVLWSGPRHIVATRPYSGDAANNAVIDRKTGLVWRRCLEGERWNADGTCTTTSGHLRTHEAVLIQAANQSGWRLPNVKELVSLSDQGIAAAALDQTLFPDSAMKTVWSSTPYAGASGAAMTVYFPEADVRFSPRTNPQLGRLVRDGP